MMKKILLVIELEKKYGPIERNLQLEQPLNALLESSGCGAVLGGLSPTGRDESGRPILTKCILDVVLTSKDKGLKVVSDFLESQGLSSISTINISK